MYIPEFKFTPIETKTVHGGIQHVFKFDKGYGASVIRHEGSYGYQSGLWEIAPWDSDQLFIGEHLLDWYDDVKGHLPWDEVEEILERIKTL